jgi:hypothetical protein
MNLSLAMGCDCFYCCFAGVEVYFTGAVGCLVATSFFFIGEASNGLGAVFLDLKL